MESKTADLSESMISTPAQLRIYVAEGPDEGMSLDLEHGSYVVGKANDCDIRLTDSSVSRHHAQVSFGPRGVEVRDLDSKNGTYFRGGKINTVRVGTGGSFRIGKTELLLVEPQLVRGADEIVRESEVEGMVGRSESMLRLFGLLERVARSSANVLVTGESGTGKEQIAAAIHRLSPRRQGPYRVVDLAAVSEHLLPAELFGHEQGAFTGAVGSRQGAFREAHGGTIFLDEIGELDAGLQSSLLRAVERLEVKPLGSSRYVSVDVRIIAATNRDLREESQQGRFRLDLYHRLMVMTLVAPPLRERTGDIPLLVEHFLRQLTGSDNPPEVSYSTMQMLVSQPWPGNVRQLRNVIERSLTLAADFDDLDQVLMNMQTEDSLARMADGDEHFDIDIDTRVPFKQAKNDLVQEWERKYLSILLGKYQGNISLAARRSGIDRVHLHRLIKKHGFPER